MCGMMGINVSPIPWTRFRVREKIVVYERDWETPDADMGLEEDSSRGRAVCLACFLRILRVASAFANESYRYKETCSRRSGLETK